MPMHCSANVGADGEFGDLLRPLRHRQDDALRLGRPRAGRRRRAWLGSRRRLQFRGRLLCQDHQAVPRGRAADLRHDPALRHGAGECGDRPGHAPARSRRRQADGEHEGRLSPHLHRQCLGHGAGRPSQEYRDADRRCLRRAAPHRQADPGAGHLSFPLRLHREGGGHGEGSRRAAADLLRLLRRPLHAATSLRSMAICSAG